MLGALEPRGPDGFSGIWDPSGRAALGIGLLRVADGPAEAVVHTNEEETLRMVCDGQVFDGDSVGSFLRGRGHRFRTDDPAELLLHLFEEEGPAGWRRVDGQFALAIWEPRGQRLTLARDFLGVRPLYYTAGPQGAVFGSEIKALRVCPEASAGVDIVGVSHYLTFLNTPGPRTLFAGIARVPPGAVVVWRPGAGLTTETYWDLLDAPIPESEDESFYVERTRALHAAALTRREGRGAIAALLSGGNDSSANAALLARVGRQPLHTFTVGLAEVEGAERYNDLHYARLVAEQIGSVHHETLLTTGEFLQAIPETVDALDDMVSEPSSVFLQTALRNVRAQGLTVVITGEANDELCCGHAEMIRIRDSYYARWLPFLGRPALIRKAAALLAPLVAPARADVLRRAAQGAPYFWNFEIAWMEMEKQEILSAAAWESCSKESAAEIVMRYARRLEASEHGRRDYLNSIIYLMMQDYYFGGLMLGKLDLLSAAAGVEARCPYTAPDYAHFVFNVPAPLKSRAGLVKYFFKKAIEGILPDEIIYRPKQGFRTPVVELFRGALGEWARPVLLETGLTRTGLLRRASLERLLKAHREGQRDNSNRLWTAMALNLWHDRWIEGARPPGELSAAGRRAEETVVRVEKAVSKQGKVG